MAINLILKHSIDCLFFSSEWSFFRLEKNVNGRITNRLLITVKSKRKHNKEGSWFYAELKSHILFQVSFVAYLKLSDETWNKMCYLKFFETFETWNFWNEMYYLKLETFETRCAIWNFQNFLKT